MLFSSIQLYCALQENQLLKDRNKTRRKRPQEDIYLTPTSPILTDGHPVKLLAVDTQNINLMGSTKGAFFKRNVDANTNFKLKATKGDLSTTRTVKQKRRAGIFHTPVIPGGNYDVLLFRKSCRSILVLDGP